MKKKNLADRLAQKSFENPSVQSSWNIHLQAFRPILENAFVDNDQAKIHLCAALNHISNRSIPQAILKLNQVQKCCKTDADKAALLFFMGLACEKAGQLEKMVQLYTGANEFGHRFYLPYMKVAKYHLEACSYDDAEKNYRAAIGCFAATGLGEQEKLLLGSAYTNLASALAMMHRYDEAEEALATSRSLYPDAPGRAAVEALLHAVHGDAEKMESCLQVLKTKVPDAWASIAKSTRKILDRTEPQFIALPVEDEKIEAFWNWFSSFSSDLKKLLDQQNYEKGIKAVAEKLIPVFPYLEQMPCISLGRNDKGYVLVLRDLYAVALEEGYNRLLNTCPEDVKALWQFDHIH